MPSGKKSKESTWKEDELLKSLKSAGSSKSSRSRTTDRESSGHREKERTKHRSREDEEGKGKRSTKSKSSHSDGRTENGESSTHHSKSGPTEKVDQDGKSERSSHKSGDTGRSHRESSSRRGHDESSERKKHRERGESTKSHEREKKREKSIGREKDRDEEDRKRHKERDREKRREKEKRRNVDADFVGEDKDSGNERGPDSRKDSSRKKEIEKQREKSRNEGRNEHTGETKDRRERKSRSKKNQDEEESGDIGDKRRSEKDRGNSRDKREKERKGEVKPGRSSNKKRSKDHSTDKIDMADRLEADVSTKDPNSSQDGKKEKQKKYHHRGSKDSTFQPVSMGNEDIVNVDAERYQDKDEPLSDEVDYDENNYDYGNDEFEDYDDDFDEENYEDESPEEESSQNEEENKAHRRKEDCQPRITLTASEQQGMEQIKKAIFEENERAESASRSPSRSPALENRMLPEDTPPSSESTLTPSPFKGRINFVAAKQKHISDSTAKKTKQRGKELLKLLELDAVSLHIFELLPMTEYELYMKSFGKTDSAQVSVQASDDMYDGETQTDETETEVKWCQHSNEIHAAGAGDEVGKKLYHADSSANAVFLTSNTVRLNHFLLKASTVCLSLLEEEAAGSRTSATNFRETKTNFSDGSYELETSHPIIQGREIKSVSPPSDDIDLLLIAYGTSSFTKENPVLASKGLLSVWKPAEADEPLRFLITGSIPTCCCFGPWISFAFAGMDDGSVAVWDLNELPGVHSKWTSKNKQLTLFSPTFTTASVLAEENHTGPVIAITVLAQNQEEKGLNEGNITAVVTDGGGLSFQLATLDESGHVNIWIIVEVQRPDIGGSEIDLGLSPGGKFKLLKTGSISLDSRPRNFLESDSLAATCFQVKPTDPNHFYIGTNKGFVAHKTRFSERASLRAYVVETDFSHAVTTLDISPFNTDFFLVGCDSGALFLYSFYSELPLLEWPHNTDSAPYTSVKWSRCKPSVFFTLNAGCTLAGWDLLKREDMPLWQENFSKGNKRLNSFTFSRFPAAAEAEENRRLSILVLFYENGSIEVHKLPKEFAMCEWDEMERFQKNFEAI